MEQENEMLELEQELERREKEFDHREQELEDSELESSEQEHDEYDEHEHHHHHHDEHEHHHHHDDDNQEHHHHHHHHKHSGHDRREEVRKCPHCGTEVKVKRSMCPECHYFLHWKRKVIYKWIDGVQSPWKNRVTITLFIVAILAQLLLFFCSKSMVIYVRIPPSYTYQLGHLFKIIGEVGLLYGLAQGLRFEMYQFTKLFRALLILLTLYHCFAIGYVYIGSFPQLKNVIGSYRLLAILLFIASYAVYGYLGVRLNRKFNGRLSETGMLMALQSILLLILHWVLGVAGSNFISDISMTLFGLFYIWFLKNRLIDHATYKKKYSGL